MRKIRKPNASETSQNQESKQLDTLLTIPPLFVGNGEFALSSCNFLMSTDKIDKTVDGADSQSHDTSDKIMFSDLKQDCIKESNKKVRAKKRKVDSDDDSDSEKNSSSNSDGSDESENDEDSGSNSDSD